MTKIHGIRKLIFSENIFPPRIHISVLQLEKSSSVLQNITIKIQSNLVLNLFTTDT